MPNSASSVRAQIRWGIAGIFVLLIIAMAFDAPQFFNRGISAFNTKTHLQISSVPVRPFHLGLDLQGGAHLLYQADLKNIEIKEQGAAVEGVRDVIERRVNGLGVAEPVVQTTKVGNDHRILVELPGVKDVKRAIEMIGGTPILEFKEQAETVVEPELSPEQKKEMDSFNAVAKKRLAEAQKLVRAGKFSDAVAQFSEDATSTRVAGGSLGLVSSDSEYPELYKWASSTKKVGAVSAAVVESAEGLNIVRLDEIADDEPLVSARHLLICFVGAKGCEGEKILKKTEAEAKIKELLARATPENFTDLIKQNSTEPGAAEKGGDLGTFSRSQMIKEFADAVYSAPVGQVIGPVETAFGYHLILKTASIPQKDYKLSRVLVRTLQPSDLLPPADPWESTGLSGKQLKRAEVVSDTRTGAVQVSLSFNDEGKALFAAITKRNLQKPVAIYLDGEAISTPTVQSEITDGQAIISGSFTVKEAQLLAQRLNAGALPVPVELISQETVGATLGADSLRSSLNAGIIGTIIIMLFMFFYYRWPGFLAVLALTVYITGTLAVFKLVGVTLTLAGIAGFIMSIGIAVDANVLVFERLKEELRAGRSLKSAVEEGFTRAWTSIRDGNTSTLITCLLLTWFGTSFVKGFAVTLAIGILMSLFTAITVTRLFLRFTVAWFPEFGNWLFVGAKKIKN